jgi:hypothetical protein
MLLLDNFKPNLNIFFRKWFAYFITLLKSSTDTLQSAEDDFYASYIKIFAMKLNLPTFLTIRYFPCLLVYNVFSYFLLFNAKNEKHIIINKKIQLIHDSTH